VSRCLQVDVDGSEVDLVSGLLWDGGVTAISELSLGGTRVRLVAGFPDEAEAALVDRLAVRWHPDTFDADHDGWLDAWRPFARPIRVGRLVVHPPWEPPPWADVPIGPADLLVPLDPGRAFGQGNHATTRLMLAALLDEVRPGGVVLDVGCGSGVLSVVSALLGAGRVVAVDIEEEAVRATRENAARNAVADRIEASTSDIDEVSGPFDLVVANILAPTLIALAPALADRARGGLLVLSGLLEEQRGAVVAAFSEANPDVEVASEVDLEGWLRLALRF
jgi:ribosomal protein L11 methyltransferase